ncbi:MAG: SHOCT domain-containing protein [Coriobacteriia bacterium]|nr:SHOCT domain-containing protein [Coriobacteriia bacterium]
MAEIEYYVGKNLIVTSARLKYRDVTCPISGVTAVRVSKLPEVETDRHGSRMARGVGLFLVGAIIAVLMLVSGLNAGMLFSIAGVFCVIGVAVAVAGARMVRSGWIADREDSARRGVIVGLSSGENLNIRVASLDTAKLIREAIEQALTSGVTLGSQSSIADELSKLAELRDASVISSEDWERAKDLYLGKRPDERAAAIIQLRRLHELHRDGILSESEFNSKKWDILSRSK